MKRIIFFITLLLFQTAAWGQLPNWYQNLEKYWWYRYRLVNDFMKIGDGAGESLPAGHRVRNTVASPSSNGELRWGDQTIDLAHYIGTLSCEYRLLGNSSYSTYRTEYELGKALNAFDRLDRDAEQYCYNVNGNYPGAYPGTLTSYPNFPPSTSLNGFFIRDDVPYLDFLQQGSNNQHFHRPGLSSSHSVNHTKGDFRGRYGGPLPALTDPGEIQAIQAWPTSSFGRPRFPVQESQDHVSEVFQGLSIVPTIVNNSSALRQQAADAAFRTINYIGTQPASAAIWYIFDPVSNKCVYGIASQNPSPCNPGGAQFIASATPATKATNVITGGYGHSSQATWLEILGNAPTTSIVFWAIQFLSYKDVNFVDNFAVYSDNWFATPLNPSFPGNMRTTWPALLNHSIKRDFDFPQNPLIYRLKYPGNGGVGYCPECYWTTTGYHIPSYENMLDNAPTCGPHDYNGMFGDRGTKGSLEWSGNDRLGEPYNRKDIGGTYGQTTYDNDDFNGLDYMELFGLYSLVKGNYLQGIMNPYYHEYFNTNYPTPSGLGSVNQKLTLNFLEYVSFTNSINNFGNVTFRGGKTVELLPGFVTAPGSVANIYVQDYSINCDDPNAPDYHYAYVTTTPIQNLSRGTSSDSLTEVTTPMEYADPISPFVNENIDPNHQLEDSLAMNFFNSMSDSDKVNYMWQQVLATGDTAAINAVKEFLLTNADQIEIMPNFNTMQNNYRKLLASPEFNFTVFPNPNDGTFTIDVSDVGNYSITVTNMIGVVVFNGKMDNTRQVHIDLGTVSSGNYIIELMDNKHGRQQHKISIIK